MTPTWSETGLRPERAAPSSSLQAGDKTGRYVISESALPPPSQPPQAPASSRPTLHWLNTELGE